MKPKLKQNYISGTQEDIIKIRNFLFNFYNHNKNTFGGDPTIYPWKCDNPNYHRDWSFRREIYKDIEEAINIIWSEDEKT